MIVAPHHKVIQTLDRVIDGEIQRLIINVPRYTKTGAGDHQYDGAEDWRLTAGPASCNLSYRNNPALLNSPTARGMIKSQAYQPMG